VVAGQCTECHNPHKSTLETLLLAPSPELCLACHQDIKEKMDSERIHPPAGRDCLRCHQPHFSEEAMLMNQPLHALCNECHEADRDSFQEAHLGIDPSTINCVSCHTPHTSKDAKFFKPKMHGPFAVRTCDPCHIVDKK